MVAGRRRVARHLKMEDGIGQVVQVDAGSDDQLAIELAVLLEVNPTNVIGRKLVLTVVGHRHRQVHDALLHPAIPIRIHVIIGARGPERLARRGGGRRIPRHKRAGLFDPRLGLLDAGVHLPDESGGLVASPLLELLATGSGVSGQTVAGIVSGHARGIVAFRVGFEANVVVMDAVNVAVGAIRPGGGLEVHQVHVRVHQILQRLGMPRVKGTVGVLGAGGGTQPGGPVIVEGGQAARRGIAVLRIDYAFGGLEGHRPAVDLDALLAAGGVVGAFDQGGQGVEVGRREARHVRLAHAGGIAHVGSLSHLDDDSVAVGFADRPRGARAGNTEQGIHLALIVEPVVEGVEPERPILSGARRDQRQQQAQ